MSDVIISAKDIAVAFDDITVLNQVSFEIEEGSFVALIGPNGCGKSTLLDILIGMNAPDAGEVRLFDEPPNRTKADRLGYLPQLKTLDRSFPAIALELVVTGLRHAWPWRIRDEERELALQAMERTGVAHLANRSVAALSGGELQRTYLARSLVRKPHLLILDEPAAGMDITGEADMYHLLEHYRKDEGATILMVTHDWEGARAHATHVLLFDRDEVRYGPAAEIGDEARLLEVFGHKGHIGATHGDHTDA